MMMMMMMMMMIEDNGDYDDQACGNNYNGDI